MFHLFFKAPPRSKHEDFLRCSLPRRRGRRLRAVRGPRPGFTLSRRALPTEQPPPQRFRRLLLLRPETVTSGGGRSGGAGWGGQGDWSGFRNGSRILGVDRRRAAVERGQGRSWRQDLAVSLSARSGKCVMDPAGGWCRVGVGCRGVRCPGRVRRANPFSLNSAGFT